MAAVKHRNFSSHDMKDEVLYFNKHWRRSFVDGRAIYTATSNKSAITLINVTPKGKLIPQVIERFKKGSRVVIIGTAVHYPPHTTINL